MSFSLDNLVAGTSQAVEGLSPAGLAYFLGQRLAGRRCVIVCRDEERAALVANDLRLFLGEAVTFFPAEEHSPFEQASPDPRITFAQAAQRHAWLGGERPAAIVTTVAALMGRWMPTEAFTRESTLYVPGEIVGRDVLVDKLVLCGYQRVNMVEDPGTFAVRGSIIDVFVPERLRPVRFDLFGDELSSIREFDPQSQRTFAPLEFQSMFPIREVVLTDAAVAHAIGRIRRVADEEIEVPTRRVRALEEEIERRDYFYGIEHLWPAYYEGSASVLESLLGKESDGTLVVLDEADELDASLEQRWSHAEAERQRRIEQHELVLKLEDHLTPPVEIRTTLSRHACLRSLRLADDRRENALRPNLGDFDNLRRELELRRKDKNRGEILDPLVSELRSLFERGYEVALTAGSRGQAERLRELLVGRKIDLPITEGLPRGLGKDAPSGRRAPKRAISVAPFSRSLEDPERRVALISDVDIFGHALRPAITRKRPPTQGLNTLKGLREGDLVIHVDHGIGRYLGLKRLFANGVDGDYVHLEYAGADKLYLPIYRLNLLQRYRGADDVRLDKLGGTRWEKAKARVKDAVLAMAHGLLRLQARRAALPGYALPAPDEHFRAFEASFPYEETPDQQRAIDEVLADLQKPTPMDRLVCGDVGFGKTEVAMRAAYLTVLSKRQVAVLVPTTVLAEQHGATFRQRLESEGVTVDVLSRFRSAKEVQELAQRVQSGAIDVLIGTHRMLSSDIHFKNLGLLVVDEEQRFGVKHKERIKELRSQVHVLTLSATPIPRTLHMAVVGVRDLSIITTPPAERMAIKTEVTKFDEDVLAEAVRRELHRGGQVFVVHNRIGSIGAMADLVRRLVPGTRVVVGHGQMAPEVLEKVMVDFVRREFDVLVCTAIIESGIDIPSANTMIINRADTFGLSQIHQLRGRIGRGRERAYAYLLLPRNDRITREAAERLQVLKRFSDLGSGYQIATHDLDLRGAGDLLGADQSGNIAAVGFELFTELLREATEQVKGQKLDQDFEPEIKLPVAAVLPETYIPEPMTRLALYQRLAQASADEQIFDILGEIRDMYGDPPEEVAYLGETMVIRRRLKALGVVQLSGAFDAGKMTLGLGFLPDAKVDRLDLANRLQKEPERYRLLPSGRLAITQQLDKDAQPLDFLKAVRQTVGGLRVGA